MQLTTWWTILCQNNSFYELQTLYEHNKYNLYSAHHHTSYQSVTTNTLRLEMCAFKKC